MTDDLTITARANSWLDYTDGATLSDASITYDLIRDQRDRIEELEAAHGRIVEAVARHFALHHSVVPWCAVILNDDGDLQTVDEVYDDDEIVVDDRALENNDG